MKIRIFLEKKKSVNIENDNLKHQLIEFLHIKKIDNVRIFTLFDIKFYEEISEEYAKKLLVSSLVEKMAEDYYFYSLPDEVKTTNIFSVALLPGQYDQKADSATSCIMLVGKIDNIEVKTGKIYCVSGNLSEEDRIKIENFLVNPVDSYHFDIYKDDLFNYENEKINIDFSKDENVNNKLIYSMNEKQFEDIDQIKKKVNLGMTSEDLIFLFKKFEEEKRYPNHIELKILDTYWSDHCRHTTFNTELKITNLDKLNHDDPRLNTLESFFSMRSQLNKNRINNKIDINNKINTGNLIDNSFTLMDLATINSKYLKAIGKLNDVEESDEINACSVILKDNKNKEWLIEFKNETHNHPTEIEPYGGASTCLGGAIRDPLSARAYVFASMRVSGSADPNQPVEKTLKGKLPQRKITTTAAKGFSSYGNQIGLATGQVVEFYHENYVAKRLEAGAVIGAVPKENVIRQKPKSGDIIILVGGRTGRDGIGGATGSSKHHDEKSIEYASSEVQKGNPVIERKLQRFFARKEVAKMILRCNDFGAGGVAVAIGEIADGLNIYLDRIPLKYKNLIPDEIILSESQERMACVIEKKDLSKFLNLASEEDLEATYVADVIKENYVNFFYKDQLIAKISRDILDSKGAKKSSSLKFKEFSCEKLKTFIKKNNSLEFSTLLKNLNLSLQNGLSQIFDSTIGGSTVFLPFGGKYQLSPSEGMAFSLPDIFQNDIDEKAVLMSMGFDPDISSYNPYIGAYFAVIESVTKLIAMGADSKRIWLSLQEYFGKTTSSEKWETVVNAMLGAVQAQKDLDIAAIGGKDSMSGTFNEIDVPPTLISFAVSYEDHNKLIPAVFSKTDSYVYLLYNPLNENMIPDSEYMKNNFKFFEYLKNEKKIISARSVRTYSIREAIFKSCIGNKIGFICENNKLKNNIIENAIFGSIIFETDLEQKQIDNLYDQFLQLSKEKHEEEIKVIYLGKTTSKQYISFNNEIDKEYYIDDLIKIANQNLKDVFPTNTTIKSEYTHEDVARLIKKYYINTINEKKDAFKTSQKEIMFNIKRKPKALILVFSGTNCEFDTRRAFIEANADVEILVIRSLNKDYLNESINQCSKKILGSEILCIPGGFSMGDEPEGSGKFIASFLRRDEIKEAVEKHLEKKNLILGICNGFQALIKSGLLPYGKIVEPKKDDPSLVQNLIGSHVSRFVYVKVLPNKSPWHILSDSDKTYLIPVSHGEGRFYAKKEVCEKLFQNNLVSSIYTDQSGLPAVEFPDNPNGSIYSIESIISPDGLILGKMGHSERVVNSKIKNLQNISGEPIFQSAVRYFEI